MKSLYLLFVVLIFSSYLLAYGYEYEYEDDDDYDDSDDYEYSDYDGSDYSDDYSDSSDGFYDDYDVNEHEELSICKRVQSGPSPLNYLGSNLTIQSINDSDIILCPGDTFGDLNDTYVTVKNCYLAMYHQDQMIWSSRIHPVHRTLGNYDDRVCAFSLKIDGEIVLYKEERTPGDVSICAREIWGFKTGLRPDKTELRVQGQRLQIVQTLEDGTQRVFYTDANYQEFREDIGEPIKVADKYLIKNHSDQESILLRRNEYIGDLNGIYLILQTNCDLQLANKNKTIWSFTIGPQYQKKCALKAQKDGQITISDIETHPVFEELGSFQQNIIMKPNEHSDLQVIQSQITFENDQLLIIQTLNNGSQITFYCGPGKDNALILKKEPRQIAENTIIVSKDGIKEFSIERMDYIGDLRNLHLILQQNCSLILANGSQKLWEFQLEYDQIIMDCSISLDSEGSIYWEEVNRGYHQKGFLLKETDSREKAPIIGLELKLEDNQLKIMRHRADKAPDVFHAGSNTRDILFQTISESSITVNHNDKDDLILSKMGYIGNLNGVYAMFEDHCRWVLYNKTQVIWESGIYPDDHCYLCKLVLKRDGVVNILGMWRLPVWSTMNLTVEADLEKKVMKAELRVDDDGLWLINTFDDETVVKYKAKEGTNNFSLIIEKEKFMVSSDL